MTKNFDRTLNVPEISFLPSRPTLVRRPQRSGASWVDRCLLRVLLGALHEPRFAFVLWNGDVLAPEGCRIPAYYVHLQDRSSLLRLMRNPRRYFGDLYAAGAIEIEGQLPEFLEHLFQSMPRERASEPSMLWRIWRDREPRSTDMRTARNNIHHHYDLGNEFYQLWLDREAMQYTCAYFPWPTATLEQAQQAKMHHVCRKLHLQPGQHVLELGCGWGGLARFMAREYGVRVRAFNISTEQIRYAREKAREEGLQDRVEFVEDDYRNAAGQYDAVMSVGMLEHVGRANYGVLGELIERSLKPDGLGLIHSIGRNRAALMNSWIENRIFPGAYPPSLREMADIFEPHRFSILDVENLRLHYAETLRHWLARFEQHQERIAAEYDAEFVRAWRLYLAGSIAAFRAGALQLFQVCFARERNNAIPWTRAHLYRDHGSADAA